MSEAEKKRVRRSAEQRAAETDAKIAELHTSVEQLETKKKAAAAAFDEKIASVQARIKTLEAKKAEILAPKKRKPRKTKKQKLEAILKQAQKAGLKPEEIAERLGVTLETINGAPPREPENGIPTVNKGNINARKKARAGGKSPPARFLRRLLPSFQAAGNAE